MKDDFQDSCSPAGGAQRATPFSRRGTSAPIVSAPTPIRTSREVCESRALPGGASEDDAYLSSRDYNATQITVPLKSFLLFVTCRCQASVRPPSACQSLTAARARSRKTWGCRRGISMAVVPRNFSNAQATGRPHPGGLRPAKWSPSAKISHLTSVSWHLLRIHVRSGLDSSDLGGLEKKY
jgi:hypothetical protein